MEIARARQPTLTPWHGVFYNPGMKSIPRIVWIGPAVAIGLGVLMVASNKLFDVRAGYAFQHVQLGDPESRVIQFMGSGTHAQACGELLYWDEKVSGKNDGRCVSEVRYVYSHSAWVIGYSADKHVVSKHHETS